MARRDLLKRLERSATGELDSFKLRDGSVFYYNRTETYAALYLFCYDMELATESDVLPQPPEILHKMCQAEDPAEVLERFKPTNPQGAFVDLSWVYDLDVLVRERRLVLRTA